MIHPTRRSVVLSATAAGAAFGLNKPLEIFPSALAQAPGPHPMNSKGSAFHKFKVGDITVTNVYDGDVYRPLENFVLNASVDDLKASLRASNLPDSRLFNAYTVTFVELGGRTIMFDAGNGDQGAPGTGTLAVNAKAAGIDLARLSAIVVTHFHPDHIFGLLTKANAQNFAETEIIVPEAEYKIWADPAMIDQIPDVRKGLARRIQSTMPGWKNIKQVAADQDALPGVRAVASYGHTAGHTSYLVSSGSSQVMVFGDVTNIPPINVRNPGWNVGFDQDPPMAAATRRRMLDRAVADKLVCAAYHWGMPGAGTIARDGNGFAMVPVA